MSKNKFKHPLHSFTFDHSLNDVNNEIPSMLLFMDQAIEKYEEELARIRRARAELAAGPDRRHRKPTSSNGNVDEGSVQGSPYDTGSIGELLMDALRTRGRLTVKQIHEWVTAHGKFAQYHTVSSMVGYYNKKKYIKRVAVGTYEIANEPPRRGRAPVPQLTNGAPVPKNGRP